MAINYDYNTTNYSTYDPYEEERKRRETELMQSQLRPVSPDSLGQVPNIGTLPTPGEPTVVAGPTQQITQQTTQQTTQPTGQQAEVRKIDNHVDYYTQAQDDPRKLLDIANSDAPDWLKERARSRATDLLLHNREQQKVQQQLPNLTESELAAKLREKTTGGSYWKAALFGILGMDQSQAAEAAKLGIGKEQSVIGDDGKPYMIKVSSNGTPIEGYNASTGAKLTPEQLVSVAGGGQRQLDIVGGTFVNDKTGEVGRVVTDKKTGTSYIQTDTGRKPMAGFRPQSSMGTMEDMRARMIQEINLKTIGKSMEEAMIIARPYNQQLIAQGIAPVQPNEIRINAPQMSTGTGASAKVTPSNVPAAAPAVVPAKTIGTSNVGQPTLASNVSPVNPNLTYTPPVNQNPPLTGTGLKGRPTSAQLEAEKTRQKEQGQEIGTDLGKLQVNQSKSEGNADYLITKVDELTTHPGFQTSVGAKGPTMGFGMMTTPISGTDAADWHARFNEVQGQSFLTAIESLRGMGALSNQEGESATKAIKRMSTTQSEGEFKQAAKEFQDIIKRGIDRNRVKLGQEPKYNIEAESEMAKKRQQGQGQWRVLNVQPGQ